MVRSSKVSVAVSCAFKGKKKNTKKRAVGYKTKSKKRR